MWKGRSLRSDLALAASLLLAPASAGAETLYLDEIPVTATSLPTTGSGVVRVTLHIRDTAAFTGAALPATPEIGPENVRFDLPESAQVEGEPGPVHRRSTFVVDFDEPEIRELAKSLGFSAAERPSIDSLVRGTDRALSRKPREWGWLVASQAVRRGKGDCTEHAVVLTALARLAGGRPEWCSGSSLSPGVRGAGLRSGLNRDSRWPVLAESRRDGHRAPPERSLPAHRRSRRRRSGVRLTPARYHEIALAEAHRSRAGEALSFRLA
jgi:hypothetical protein